MVVFWHTGHSEDMDRTFFVQKIEDIFRRWDFGLILNNKRKNDVQKKLKFDEDHREWKIAILIYHMFIIPFMKLSGEAGKASAAVPETATRNLLLFLFCLTFMKSLTKSSKKMDKPTWTNKMVHNVCVRVCLCVCVRGVQM